MMSMCNIKCNVVTNIYEIHILFDTNYFVKEIQGNSRRAREMSSHLFVCRGGKIDSVYSITNS